MNDSGAVHAPHEERDPAPTGTMAANIAGPRFASGTLRIGILSHPCGGASATPPLMNLIEVVAPAAKEISVVAGAESCIAFESLQAPSSEVHLFPVQGLFPTWAMRTGLHRRVFNFVLTQCRAALLVYRARRRVDIWIFYIDGQNQVLPMLIARLFNRPVLLLMAYSAVETLRRTNRGMAAGARVLSSLTCTLSDRIAVASEKFIEDWCLERWRDKVRVAHEHYIDLDGLSPGPPIRARDGRIGYVGRFAAEKGIMEFLEAAGRLHAADPELRFIVIGDGPLRKAVDEAVRLNGLQDCLTMTGWLPAAAVRDNIREFTLLVVPSYTESGPMVAYEALALGTPILITKTGLVAGMLDEGLTGFLLDDPSPTSIVEGVLRALASPSLDRLSLAGRNLVSDELSLAKTRSRLVQVILDVVNDHDSPLMSSIKYLPSPEVRERGG